MAPTTDVTPASSPAPLQPESTQDFRTFRETENAAAVARHQGREQPKAESAPAPDKSAAPDKPDAEKAAPASEAGNQSQEPKRSNAETRIRELVAKNKTLEAELAKHRQPKQDVKPESSPAAKAEAKPEAKGLEQPKKPKYEDFSGDDAWQKFEEARDQYFEELADYKAAKRLDEYRQTVAQEAQQRELLGMVEKTSERYGAEAKGVIGEAVQALAGDDIPGPVKAALDRAGEDIADLLYVIGSKPEDLSAFADLAKSDPIAAIQQIGVMRHLIRQERGKPAEAKAEPEATRERGEDGRFVKKEPETTTTKAPPIGTEVSGRGAAAPDATVAAAKNNDFKSFKAAEDQKEIERRRGRR